MNSINLTGLNTSKVTDMSYLFAIDYTYDYTKDSENEKMALSNIEGLNSLNTSNVQTMCNMFWNCGYLTTLDLSGFNTANVTNFNMMINMPNDGSALLNSIVLGENWSTLNAIDMSYMFVDCANLKSLDLSMFNTSNVTNMSGMFRCCRNLKTIYVSDNWNTSSVTRYSDIFSYCNKLEGSNGTKWNSNNESDKTYARVDGGNSNPGYLTLKSN